MIFDEELEFLDEKIGEIQRAVGFMKKFMEDWIVDADGCRTAYEECLKEKEKMLWVLEHRKKDIT